jgi:hypothetical protein
LAATWPYCQATPTFGSRAPDLYAKLTKVDDFLRKPSYEIEIKGAATALTSILKPDAARSTRPPTRPIKPGKHV